MARDQDVVLDQPLLQPEDAAFDGLPEHPGGVRQAFARLIGAAARGRLPHALLLAGPSGAGKRWLAVRLAQRLRCEQPLQEPEGNAGGPCLRCPRCQRIERGIDTDVTLMTQTFDEKRQVLRSEISIEQVRALQDRLTLRSAGGWRVAIVDPADRLSGVAQEAMLKTLEEPPAGVLLALLTPRPSSLKPTVRSRCQLVRLAPPPVEAVAAVIARRGLDAGSASRAAALAGGDLRVAQSLDADEASERWLSLARALYEILGAGNKGEGRARDVAVEAVPKKGEEEEGGARDAVIASFLDLLEAILRDAMIAGVEPDLADDDLAARLTHPGGAKAARSLAGRLPPERAAMALARLARARDDLRLHCSAKVLLTSLLLDVRALRADAPAPFPPS